MVDPRKRRGVRHGLVVVLTAAVCAAGARSFVAVAEWVADLPDELAAVLGVDRRYSGATNIAAALRHHGRNALRPLHLLKIN